MKALWIVIAVAALIVIGARQGLTIETPPNELAAARALESESQSNEAQAAEALARKTGCLECHSIDKSIVGPAYRDIAERYKDDSGARAALINKVKNGSKNNWTKVSRGIPMPPHSKILTTAEIERLVDWVLSLNDTDVR